MKIILLTLLFFKTIFAFGGIHPSLLLFHEWDLVDCRKQALKIIAMGAQKVNVVPTLHYFQEDHQLKSFCFKRISHKCEPITPTITKDFSRYLYQCLKPLNEHGVSIKITPHLDAVNLKSFWRNRLVFEPQKKYQGLSYQEIMINPIIKALKRLSFKKSSIQLSMQGEMGATIFSSPKRYLKLYDHIKRKLPLSEVGISMNHNDINGGVTDFNLKDMQELIEQVDFIGYSAYTPIKLDKKNEMNNHFSNSVQAFKQQWRNLEISFPMRKKIIFSEVGIGGGTSSYDGITIAKDIFEAASVPHAGITNITYNPWAKEDLRLFRRHFYLKLARFMNKQKYRFFDKVHDAYLWNANSWDVLGLYPQTSLYKDNYIINNLIKLKP